MAELKINTFRIEVNYAVVQGSYWSSMCTLAGFTAVFLSYNGLTNTQIGLTSSIAQIISMFIQLFISNFADANPRIPLKKIINILYIAAIAGCAVVWLLPLPTAMLIIVFSIAVASQQSNNGLLNATMIQISNLGYPVNYGWPRGIGSIAFALTAYFLGIAVANFSPAILMPVFIALTALSSISLLLMPDPNKLPVQLQAHISGEKAPEKSSYLGMIRGNRTLLLFLLSTIPMSAGLSSVMVFLIRIIESLGGGAKEFGIAWLIHSSFELPTLFASGWLLRKFKVQDILVVSFFFFFVKNLAIYFAPSIGAIYGIMTLNLFCIGLYAFGSVVFVNSITRTSEKVRAQSVTLVFQAVGSIIGSYLGGSIIDSMGIKSLVMTSTIVSLAATVIMFICRQSAARARKTAGT